VSRAGLSGDVGRALRRAIPHGERQVCGGDP
jgi:hypothetical protein